MRTDEQRTRDRNRLQTIRDLTIAPPRDGSWMIRSLQQTRDATTHQAQDLSHEREITATFDKAWKGQNLLQEEIAQLRIEGALKDKKLRQCAEIFRANHIAIQWNGNGVKQLTNGTGAANPEVVPDDEEPNDSD